MTIRTNRKLSIFPFIDPFFIYKRHRFYAAYHFIMQLMLHFIHPQKNKLNSKPIVVNLA